MHAVTHSAVSGATRLAAKAKRLVLRSIRAVMEARMRRIQYELQFRRSFNAYRKGKDIPALNEDLRAGS
jgi:hypothetical protein